MPKKLTKEEFVKKSKIVHKDSKYEYSYDKFDYINNRTKSIITCEKHGEFEQTPNDHLSGKGCLKCAGTYKSNLEEFVEKSKIVHKDSLYKYTYDNFVYVNAHTKGTITCEKHGDFEQTPNNHLRGRGCPECWRERQRQLRNIKWFDRYDKGILYLIECWNDVERFVKIGLTSKTVKERYKQNFIPYNYTILKEIHTNSEVVSDTEQYIIEVFESYKPILGFGGDSECLNIDEKFQIVEFLENLEKDLEVS